MANILELIIQGTDKASKTLKGISKEIDQMGKKMQIAGGLMMGAGTIMVAGVLKMADSYATAGDEIAKMSKKTGISTEALSELKYMADMSGTSLGAMETSIRMMQRGLLDASLGTGEAKDALEMLGIKIEDIIDLKPEEQFWTLATALAEVKDPTMKAAVAMNLFGRSGTDLLPILAEGREGIAQMKDEAKKLNVVFDKDAAEAAEKFKDTKERIGKALAGLSAEIMEDILPTLTRFFDKIVAIIGKIKYWAELNPGLAETILKIGAVLIGAGGLLLAVGTVSRAIIALNAAIIIMHGLTGVGWLKIGAGLAVAAAGIIGMMQLMKTLESPPPEPTPTMQYGGIVPGPRGQPIPIIAHGGEMFLGEGKAFGITVNVNVEGSVVAEQDLVARIREELYSIRRHNVTLWMS